MKTASAHIRVLIAHTDAGGIVYHARYLEFMEAGRNELLRALGLPYKKMNELGYQLPVIDLQIKYSAPAVYDDELEIKTSCSIEGSRVLINHKVMRGSTLLAEGTTTHVFINKEFHPIRPPKEFLELISKSK